MNRWIQACLLALAFVPAIGNTAQTQTPTSTPVAAMTDAESARMASRVRNEFLHAWRGYKRYAWGHDALQPLSRKPHDWYGQSLLMTPVDALDTMLLMGLDDEAKQTRELI